MPGLLEKGHIGVPVGRNRRVRVNIQVSKPPSYDGENRKKWKWVTDFFTTGKLCNVHLSEDVVPLS